MPQPREYANRAAQQAAYRKRQAAVLASMMAAKGLPKLPAIPSIPGHARWKAMIAAAQTLLQEAGGEMQGYHDDRSEEWQDTEMAEDLLGRAAALEESALSLEGIY